MTCHDFRRRWDELLDGEVGLVTEESALNDHAARCPACRRIHRQYQGLRTAIRAWDRRPMPPADLARRILSAPYEPVPKWRSTALQAWRRHRRAATILAASILLALGINGRLSRHGRTPSDDGARPAPRAPDRDLHSVAHPPESHDRPGTLGHALAEATSAALDLARSASGPAGRISRDLLDVAGASGEVDGSPRSPTATPPGEPAGGLTGLPMSLPSLDALASGATPPATRLLRQVEDQASAGAGPLSSTARHAFDFLLGPTRSRARTPATRPTPTGA